MQAPRNSEVETLPADKPPSAQEAMTAVKKPADKVPVTVLTGVLAARVP